MLKSLLFLSFLGAVATAQPRNLTVVGTTNTQALVSYLSPDASACTLSDSLGSHDLDPALFTNANLDTSRASTITSGNFRFVVIGSRYTAQMDLGGTYTSRALPAYTADTLTVTCTGGAASASFRTKNIPLGNTFSESIPGDRAHPGNIGWPEFKTFSRTEVLVDPQTGLQMARASLPQDVRANTSAANVTTTPVAAAGSGTWTIPGDIQTTAITFVGSGSGTQRWLCIPFTIAGMSGSYQTTSNSLDFIKLHTQLWSSGSGDAVQLALTTDCATPVNPSVLITKSSLSTTPATVVNAGDGYDGPNGATVTPILSAWGVNQSHHIDHVMASETTFGLLIRLSSTSSTNTISIQAPNIDYGTSAEQGIGSSAMQDTDFACADFLIEDIVGSGNFGRMCASLGQNYWISETNFGDIRNIGGWGYPYQSGLGGHPAGTCGVSALDLNNPRIAHCPVTGYSGKDWVYKYTYYGDYNVPAPGWLDASGNLPVCNGGHTNTPCGDFVELTGGVDLLTQCRTFNPEINALKAAYGMTFVGHQGPTSNVMQFQKLGQQNGNGFWCLFDPTPTTGSPRVVAARNSWSLWPNRWTGPHSNQYRRGLAVGMPNGGVTSGALSGHAEVSGYGPYRSRTTTSMGALTACPANPGGNNITDWPVGTKCVQVTVDGEPCDPSPAWATGTIATTAGSGTVNDMSVVSTGVPQGFVGSTFTIAGDATVYTLTGIDGAGNQTFTPVAAGNNSGAAMTMILEPADGGTHCGVSTDFFLQAAQVRDTFFSTTQNTPGGTGQENFRLLIKTGSGPGSVWWLESNYQNQAGTHTNWASGTYLYAISAINSPDQTIDTDWDWQLDPTGTNEASNSNNYLITSGHGFYSNGMMALFSGINGCGGGTPCTPCPGKDAGAYLNWAGADIYSNCFFSKRSATNTPFVNSPIYYQPLVPPFHKLMGCCYANDSDSHPGYYQITAVPNEQRWYQGAIVFNGSAHLSDFTLVSGQLYKSAVASIATARLCATWAACLPHYHALDMMRDVWAVPAVDISGPASSIGTTSADAFKSCQALAANECVSGSAAGDLFVNAPGLTDLGCVAPPQDGTDWSDKHDPCFGFNSAYMQSIVQHDAARQNMGGETGRVLGHLLSHRKPYSPFWNTRAASDGSFGFTQARYVNNMRSELIVYKIPPFPAADSVNRTDYIPIPVPVTVPSGLGITNVIAEFGYLEYGGQFFCSPNRQENCQMGNQAAGAWSWVTEAPTGLACTTTCTVTIPALSSRVLYYHVLYLDRFGAVQFVSPTQITATP